MRHHPSAHLPILQNFLPFVIASLALAVTGKFASSVLVDVTDMAGGEQGERTERKDDSSAGRPNRGGRGRYRGRGRGRGRRGGRGKSSHHDSRKRDDETSQVDESTKKPNQNRNAGNENEGRDDMGNASTASVHSEKKPNRARGEERLHWRGRGRGGRGRSGRGGGRGRRGGSRGRGGRHRGRDPQDKQEGGQPSDESAPKEEKELGADAIQDNGNSEFDNGHDKTESLPVEDSKAEASAANTLNLPELPSNLSPTKSGVPMILTRSTAPKEDSRNPATVEAADTAQPAPKKAERKKKQKKNKKAEEKPKPVEEKIEEVEVSATDAIRALPAQEVSITATSLVKVRKVDSSGSISKLDEKKPAKIIPRGKSRKKKGLSNDDRENQRAARRFNRDVKSSVDRSDPGAMQDLLRDKRNHNFALEANVLETALKAMVVAAMFEDALYCLHNCTLPATLSSTQTERILLCLPQNLRNSSAYTAADMINALCIATAFDQPTKRTYFLRIVRGIALEFLEEATSARDRICSAPCERLVRSAQCVVDARLKRGKKATEIVVDPGHQLGVFVPETMENRGIQTGDAVSILPYAGPYPLSAESLDRNMIEATVTNTNPMVLRLQDKMNASLYAILTENVDGNVYRIDKLANRMGFNRQLAAAVSIVSPLEEKNRRDLRRPSPELIQAISAMDENIDRVLKLSEGFRSSANEQTSTAALCAQPVPWSASDEVDGGSIDADSLRDSSKLALEKFGSLKGLNDSQRLAVEGAACNRLTLVQGPPGTGKTAVAIRILQYWARLAKSEADGQPPNPILATSDSNIAVDNLVEGCANVGLQVVRLGRPEAIRPELLRFCIDRPTHSNQSNSHHGFSGSAFKEKIKYIRNAQVVCCTCIGSGGDILDNMVFERVLVDEATQATEPAVLVPISRGCRQLVLVGDHCQLPPTVLSTRAEEEGLGVPLFSRMVACGVLPYMLDTQYRMHPAIAMFPSDLFYGGKLLSGVSPPERRPLAGFPWPREEFPVAFLPVQGIEEDDGVSKKNQKEADTAFEVVRDLLEGGQCSVSDIAVVTPYASQAKIIRRRTRELSGTRGPPYVEVSSTDGFQGREKEAVVFSAVRSNDYGAVGFVSDWRRVNVSFTRARRALIVIGNDKTLRRGDPETWGPWLAWADAHGINMDKPGVPRGRYEPEQLRRVRGGTTAAEMLKDVLQRQQDQLKSAEKQLENAERNAAGHIMAKAEDEEDEPNETKKVMSIEEDLALMANTDGDWDDSDGDDEYILEQSLPKSMSTTSLSNKVENLGSDDADAPLDAWDL